MTVHSMRILSVYGSSAENDPDLRGFRGLDDRAWNPHDGVASATPRHRFGRYLFCAVALGLLAGCTTARRVVSPVARLITPSGVTVSQEGDAKTPAKVETNTATRTVPLPAGTSIIFDEKLGTVTLQLSKDSTLRTETRIERAEAPQAFTPPAPPSPVEETAAKVHGWFWVGLVIGVAGALFGLVRHWDFVMYGGIAIAGGCAFALFVQAHPLVFVLIGLGVALKVVGPLVWHTKLKSDSPLPPSIAPFGTDPGTGS